MDNKKRSLQSKERSDQISDNAEDEQKHELRDPEDLIFVHRGSPRSDIIGIRSDEEEKNERTRQKDGGIAVKCSHGVQSDECDQHTGDAAARALPPRNEAEGAGNADVRKGYEKVVRKSG